MVLLRFRKTCTGLQRSVVNREGERERETRRERERESERLRVLQGPTRVLQSRNRKLYACIRMGFAKGAATWLYWVMESKGM